MGSRAGTSRESDFHWSFFAAIRDSKVMEAREGLVCGLLGLA